MSEPFIGQIQPFGFNFAPRNWAQCNGQLLPISQNTALFSLLGTTYGGDGRTTFALPDLRGRVAIHDGTGPGLSNRRLGNRGGQETVTLSTSQMPQHNHTATGKANCVEGPGNTNVAKDNFWSKDLGTQSGTYHSGPNDAAMAANTVAVTVNNNGSSQGHTNLQPFLVLNWCISLSGIFPSRN